MAKVDGLAAAGAHSLVFSAICFLFSYSQYSDIQAGIARPDAVELARVTLWAGIVLALMFVFILVLARRWSREARAAGRS